MPTLKILQDKIDQEIITWTLKGWLILVKRVFTLIPPVLASLDVSNLYTEREKEKRGRERESRRRNSL